MATTETMLLTDGDIHFNTIDDILEKVGSYGRYQILLTIALCTFIIPLSFPILIMYFTALEPPWRCVRNSTVCITNQTMTSGDLKKCSIPRSEWEFTEDKDYSIITQFDIYCDRKWIIHLTTSALFIGWGLGSIIFGWIADNFGRKIVIAPSLLVVIMLNFLSAFSPNALIFTLGRLLIGVFISGVYYPSYLCMSEFTSNKYRPFSLNMIKCSFPIGLTLLALKAYFLRNWKFIHIACSVPYLLVLGFVIFIPESIRWLHVQRKDRELRLVLHKVAVWNKKTLPPSFTLSPPSDTSCLKSNPLDLFRSKSVAIKSAIHGYAWLVITMVFYGLTLASSDLGGSIYTNFVLISLSEIPGALATIYLCKVIGRKKTVCSCIVLSSLFCITITFIPISGKLKIIRVVFGIIGKICVSVSFSAILIWSLEIYPTSMRAQATGFFQLTGRVGSSSAPWIAKALNRVYFGSPFLVMGVSLLIGAFMLVTLPEPNGMSFLEQEKSNMHNDCESKIQNSRIDGKELFQFAETT